MYFARWFQYLAHANLGPQLSVFDDFPAHLFDCNLLKTVEVCLVSNLLLFHLSRREALVIIFALVAALILLVAVTLISSIDSSRTRRH